MRVAMSGSVVKLLPANDYTDEIVTRHYFNRVKLEPPDPRMENASAGRIPMTMGISCFAGCLPGDTM